MSRYIVSPQAVDDLIEIWRYLAEHAGVDIANLIEDEIHTVSNLRPACPGKAIDDPI